MPANRNLLFMIIGALVVVVGVLSYNLYQDRKQPQGLQINVGPNGMVGLASLRKTGKLLTQHYD